MSEDQTNGQELSAEEQAAMLEDLKNKADQLGVKYHPNIGMDTLRERIAEAQNPPTLEQPAEVTAAVAAQPVQELSAAELENLRLKEMKNKAMALKRVRIVCMDPSKREWQGEIISAGNRHCQAKRMIPFNQVWHVEQIILNYLSTKKCQTFYTEKVNGQDVRRGQLIPAYAIEMLPDLTEEEIKDLAQRQAMANGTAAVR